MRMMVAILIAAAAWAQSNISNPLGPPSCRQCTVRTGNTLIVLGDSIVGASTTYSSVTISLSTTWPNQLNVRSNQQIRYLYNAGIAGNTCAQAYARNSADVISRSPAVAALECGTNDVGDSVPFATTIGNIQAIVSAWIIAGIRPVLCTIPPRSDNDAYIGPISQLNSWISSYGIQQGIPVVDFYGLLVDPTNGHYKAGFSGDGVHPTAIEASAMADLFISSTSGYFPNAFPYLPEINANAIDLATNNLFVNGSGVPTGWLTFKSNSGCVDSMTANATPGGNWYQWVCTNNTGTDQLYADIASGWSIGDNLAFVGKINTTGVSSGVLNYTIQIEALNGNYFISELNTWLTDETGRWYLPITVVAGTTNIRPKISITSGSGTIQVTQIGVLNLTTEKVLP